MRRPLTQRARALRRRQTDAEIKLWRYLKDLNRAGHQFRHQAPIGPYIVDFASHTHRLVIELDGSQHDRPREMARDAARDRWLAGEGYRVLRFWNSDVLLNTEGVIGGIFGTVEGEVQNERWLVADCRQSGSSPRAWLLSAAYCNRHHYGIARLVGGRSRRANCSKTIPGWRSHRQSDQRLGGARLDPSLRGFGDLDVQMDR